MTARIYLDVFGTLAAVAVALGIVTALALVHTSPGRKQRRDAETAELAAAELEEIAREEAGIDWYLDDDDLPAAFAVMPHRSGLYKDETGAFAALIEGAA